MYQFFRNLYDLLLHVYYSCVVKSGKEFLLVSVEKQRLALVRGGEIIRIFPISTAKNGTGEQDGSGKTPRGWFSIDEKIGHDQPLDMVFKSREPLSKYDATLHVDDPILTRIFWLSGLQGHNYRTKSRYIYIHGTPVSCFTDKKPMSAGCIRMLPQDCIELFSDVDLQSWVYIYDADNIIFWQRWGLFSSWWLRMQQ